MKDINHMPPVMILCGGQGTRIRDVSEVLPKPMVPIGPNPIVWHIMKTYAAFGFNRFILCLGYKREVFVDYFLNYHARSTDITVQLGKQQKVTYHGSICENWEVTLADTGEKTMTGGRVARAAKYLRKDDEDFCLTYGDGVANVDLGAVYAQHQRNEASITVSAVHPSSRFGEMNISGESVTAFHEKPQTDEGFINGGYMVVSRKFVDKYLTTDQSLIFEQEPMIEACRNGDMEACKHDGFWQCMDTAREFQLLNDLWDSGKAPWTQAWS